MCWLKMSEVLLLFCCFVLLSGARHSGAISCWKRLRGVVFYSAVGGSCVAYTFTMHTDSRCVFVCCVVQDIVV